MPRNRNAAKLAKNDTRFHWQCQGRTGGALVDEAEGGEASATEAAAYAYTYIGGKRICGVSGAYWGGPGHDFWLAINTQKYWVLSAAGYMGSNSSVTPLLPPYFPPLHPFCCSDWKLLLITERGLKAEKWFLACGSHLTKQLMRLLNWQSLHRSASIYIHILIVNKPPRPIILP